MIMTGTKKMASAIAFGLGMILLLATIASLFVAFLARLTTMNDSTLSSIILVFAIISMLVAGFVAGVKAKTKGWLVGSLTGLSFALLILLFQYLGFGKSLAKDSILYHIGYIAASTIGGIIGVNTTKKE